MSNIEEQMNYNANVLSSNNNVDHSEADAEAARSTIIQDNAQSAGKVVLDDQDEIIGFCKVVTDHPTVTFGKFKSSVKLWLVLTIHA